jgi:hypothetical protein
MPEEPSDQESNHNQAEVTSLLQSAEPVAMTPDHEPQPWLQEKPSGRKKGPIAAIVIVFLAVFLGFGGWAAYALWYQNPEKVLMDAMVNSMTAKTFTGSGTYSAKDKTKTSHAVFDSKAGYIEGLSGTAKLTFKSKDTPEINLDSEIAHDPEGDYYIKVNHLKDIYNTLIERLMSTSSKGATSSAIYENQAKEFYKALFLPVVERIDGKWVTLRIDDIKNISNELGEGIECTEKTLKGLGTDSSKLIEMGTIYQKSKFIVIKENLGIKNGDIGFLIDADKDAVKRFGESFKSSKLYKELKACAPDSKSLDAAISDMTSIPPSNKIEVWINQMTHQFVKIHVSVTDKDDPDSVTTFDLSPKFNTDIQVTIPNDSIPFKNALPDLSQFFSSSFSA